VRSLLLRRRRLLLLRRRLLILLLLLRRRPLRTPPVTLLRLRLRLRPPLPPRFLLAPPVTAPAAA